MVDDIVEGIDPTCEVLDFHPEGMKDNFDESYDYSSYFHSQGDSAQDNGEDIRIFFPSLKQTRNAPAGADGRSQDRRGKRRRSEEEEEEEEEPEDEDEDEDEEAAEDDEDQEDEGDEDDADDEDAEAEVELRKSSRHRQPVLSQPHQHRKYRRR